jgi:hypothetical protein
MHRAALATPLADVQRHLRRDRAAGPAQLAGREPAVDHDEFAPEPGALVLRRGAQFRPRRIGDGAGEAAVPQQVADGEVLGHDRSVLTDESSRQLVQEVAAPVRDPRVSPSDAAPGHTVAVVGSAPSGSGRDQRTSSGCTVFAGVSSPSRHVKALRVYSADARDFFRDLKRGYFARLAKKFPNAV